jgi:hypothetical protein
VPLLRQGRFAVPDADPQSAVFAVDGEQDRPAAVLDGVGDQLGDQQEGLVQGARGVLGAPAGGGEGASSRRGRRGRRQEQLRSFGRAAHIAASTGFRHQELGG